MDDRKRLIGLLSELPYRCTSEQLADYFIQKGVLAPPCRIGDKIYAVLSDGDDGTLGVEELTVTEVGTRRIFFSAFAPPQNAPDDSIFIDRLGTDFFLDKQEAQRSINERKAVGRDR